MAYTISLEALCYSIISAFGRLLSGGLKNTPCNANPTSGGEGSTDNHDVPCLIVSSSFQREAENFVATARHNGDVGALRFISFLLNYTESGSDLWEAFEHQTK